MATPHHIETCRDYQIPEKLLVKDHKPAYLYEAKNHGQCELPGINENTYIRCIWLPCQFATLFCDQIVTRNSTSPSTPYKTS